MALNRHTIDDVSKQKEGINIKCSKNCIPKTLLKPLYEFFKSICAMFLQIGPNIDGDEKRHFNFGNLTLSRCRFRLRITFDRYP